MTTPQFLPIPTNRRRLILVNNKWRVEIIWSRRRELLLRELCQRYYVSGYTRSLADAVNVDDNVSSCIVSKDAISVLDQVRGRRHQSETLALLANLEHTIRGTSEALHSKGDANDDLQPYPSGKIYLESGSHQFISVEKSLSSINAPLLRLGSKQNTWLDFGSDAFNIVGRIHSLPIIIQAPGSSRENDSDLAIYFDVEIGSISLSSMEKKGSFRFCLDINGIDCSTEEGFTNNSIMKRFTIEEAKSRVVYVTWAPTSEGCLRESIYVKTSFNGTEEQIAEEEIIIVGCARRESNHMIVQNDKVFDSGSSTHHFDLAQCPLDHQRYGTEYEDYQSFSRDFDDSPESTKDEHEIFKIDEEEKQNDLSHINEKKTLCDVVQTLCEKSHVTTSHSTSHGNNGPIQNKSSMNYGMDTTTTKATSQQQNRSSIERSITYNHQLAKFRALRVTNSLATARDRYGQRMLPLRATHPLAASNHPGLSQRAKFLRYNRYTRPQPQRRQDLSMPRQEEAVTQLLQADNLPLEESKVVDTLQNDEVLAVEEVANDESSLESSSGQGGVIELSDAGSSETSIAAGSSNVDCQKEEIPSGKFANTESAFESRNRKLGMGSIVDSPKVEYRNANNRSGQSVENVPPCQSDRFARPVLQDDVAGHETNAPSTNVTLQTMIKVCVEVDDANLAAPGEFSHHHNKQNENVTSSLADEISDIQDYLTSASGEVSSSMVSAVDVSSDLSYDVTEDQLRTTNDAETASEAKAFIFDEFPSSPSAHLRSEGSADTDEESTTFHNAAHVKKSYESVTNELNDLMNTNDKIEPTSTKHPNTPLKDLHDQINFLINTHNFASPTKKNKEFTPEPDSVVPLVLDNAPVVIPSSESYISSSSKAKHQPSITNNSLDRVTRQPEQSSRGSAKKSARKLYFYKSPRNADKRRSKAARTLASNGMIENDEHKNDVVDNVSSSQDVSCPLTSLMATNDKTHDESEVESKQKIPSERLSKPSVKSELRKSYPLQTVRTDIESNYKTRLQSIRKNRSSDSLTTIVAETTQNEPPQEGAPQRDDPIVQPQASARKAARKLYFFKAPSERINDPGSWKSENGASEAANVLDSKNKPPLQAPNEKSTVPARAKLSLPAPALSSRELMAIEKHVQSMKRSNRNSIA